MHNVSGPTLYIVRFYRMKRNRRQTKPFILLLDWTPSTFTTEEGLILAHSSRALSMSPGDLCCTSLSLTAFVFDHLCLSLLCWGPEAVFGFAAAREHTVLRARSDHVGSFSASSGGHAGCKQTEGWITGSSYVLLWRFVRSAVGLWQVPHRAAKFTCLTWCWGKVVLTCCDKVEVWLQSGDGAPGTDAAITRKTSSE